MRELAGSEARIKANWKCFAKSSETMMLLSKTIDNYKA